MKAEDLLTVAANFQRGESARKNTQAKAILDLYAAVQKAKALDEGMPMSILMAKSAEALYADEDMYLSALSKLQGVHPSLAEDSKARKAIFARYLVEKYDFAKTLKAVESVFDDASSFQDFLKKVRANPTYLYMDDDTLSQVYDMLRAKDLVE